VNWSEVKYQPERTKTYLGSPSIVRLPDGVLLAAHDYFGKGCPKNYEAEESLTSIYHSEDNGVTWQNTTHIMNCYWSSLFIHRGCVYILGTSQQYGSIVIRRSDDGGFTWTHPSDRKSGILFEGGGRRETPNYHGTACSPFFHHGRLYSAFEDGDPLEWYGGFQSFVISIQEDADLLDADNWIMSNKLPFDPAWIPADWGQLKRRSGWLEGNVISTPDDKLWNILRFDTPPALGKATIVQIHDQGRRITFDPGTGFIDFPGGASKFTIRRDPKTGLYLSLVNNNTDPAWPDQRNILSLTVSEDLRNWHHVITLMEDDTGLSHEDSIRLTGFQYVDWQFDGDDIIYVVRAAYRGAIRYHDSNRIIYRVLKNYPLLLNDRIA
jgi:hypothetical protein